MFYNRVVYVGGGGNDEWEELGSDRIAGWRGLEIDNVWLALLKRCDGQHIYIYIYIHDDFYFACFNELSTAM